MGHGVLVADRVEGPPRSLKVLVAGGRRAGTSSFVRAASDIPTSDNDSGRPARGGIPDPIVDFGRVALPADRMTAYLFGLPPLSRWWFMWPELARGAAGAVALVDIDRLATVYPVIDTLTAARLPFVVAVNRCHDVGVGQDEVRAALSVGADVSVVACDARARRSVLAVLTLLTGDISARPAPPDRNRCGSCAAPSSFATTATGGPGGHPNARTSNAGATNAGRTT